MSQVEEDTGDLTGLEASGGHTLPLPQNSSLRPDDSSVFVLILLRKPVLSELPQVSDEIVSDVSKCLLLLLLLLPLVLGVSNCALHETGGFTVDKHDVSKQNSCEQW